MLGIIVFLVALLAMFGWFGYLVANDVSVVTNVSADHLGEYGVATLEDIAHAKLVVARAVADSGTLVLNGSDTVLMGKIGQALERAAALAAMAAMAAPTSDRWKPAISASPSRDRTTPSMAVAMRPPVRETALLNPEAVPTCFSSTEPSTEAVSGATASAIPAAITAIAGKTVVQ